MNGVLQKFVGKTVICTTHDLDMLPFFDTILVFDQGLLVGVGTHAELLASCSQFQELCAQK